MLISHETPISHLETSRNYNDYDYCLVHLLDQHPKYEQFFQQSLLRGREVLLDNSIFELKTAFASDKFAAAVEKMKPTYYVVPDVLESSYDTMASWEEFDEEYSELPGLRIGVVQGNSYESIVNCYKFMKEHADYIAISFDYSWYQLVGISPNRMGMSETRLHRQCTGRQHLISRLIADGIWDSSVPHHLLGCSLAREFKFYRENNIKGIRSVDTSNPIIASLHNMRYVEGIGLSNKPSTLLADMINHEVTVDEIDLIKFNTSHFRKIVNG